MYFVLAKSEYRWHLISHKQLSFVDAKKLAEEDKVKYPRTQVILAQYYDLFDLDSENLDAKENLIEEETGDTRLFSITQRQSEETAENKND